MPKLKWTAYWSLLWQKKYNLPKGFFLCKIDPFYHERLVKAMLQVEDLQAENAKKLLTSGKGNSVTAYVDSLIPLEMETVFHRRKRTLDQNALLWALYEIEANVMNGGQKGHKDQMVTKDELYLADLDEWGERETITTRRKNLGYYLSEYRIIEAVILEDGKEIPVEAVIESNMSKDDLITLRVVRGTSKFDTREMAVWIEGVFNRLAYNGVPLEDSSKIEDYWKKWNDHLNTEKIIIHDDVLTHEEYKSLKLKCEGCGAYIGDGSGQLAHIKALGMGADRKKEPTRNYTSNWLHLCIDCHIGTQHQKGWNEFLKKCNHLRYKVKTALNRDYEPLEEIENFKAEIYQEGI
jgi:hypothetical protein